MTLMPSVPFLSLLPLTLLATGLPTQPPTLFPPSTLPAIAPSPQLVSLTFKPRNLGAPPATAGGASRGACQEQVIDLIPVMPTGQIGLTLVDRPSFFVFVPKTSIRTGEFLLLGNDDTEVLYQSTFKIPDSPAVLYFELPADAPALKVGQQYHWYISLVCDPLRPSTNPTTGGWVERISPTDSLSRSLAKAKPSDRPQIFAEAGIWHDTLTTLVGLRRSTPNNPSLAQAWTELLQSVGLTTIASEPIVETKIK